MLLSWTVVFANEVEQHLRSQYRGKILAARGFYSGEHLAYDSAGTLTGGGPAGDWTTDGFVQIDDVHLSGEHLKIKATRLMVVSQGQKGLQFGGESAGKKHKKPKKAAVVEIDVATGSGDLTDAVADTLLSKVFLNAQDSFSDAVPIYWKRCIDDSLSGKSEECRFSSDMSTVPGVTTSSRISGDPGDLQFSTGSNATATGTAKLFKVGHGVKPPRATYQPEPSFSEPARRAKYQGVVTMSLIVDKDGLPQKIRILSPLGAGLDAKAVEAVSTWKFQPAEKDGEPVSVQIAVEVNFRLY